MGMIQTDHEERGPTWLAALGQRAAEVLVKAGLEALIASGVLAAVFLGGLALVMQDLPLVLAAAGVLFLVLFVVAMETLIQQLRAVDLEMTALRCHGRTDPEQSPEEARRDCARVVLRPIYNHLLGQKPGRVSVAFHVWDEGGQHFRHVVATPEFRPAERDGVAQLGRDSAAGRALGDGEPNIISDVAAPEARQRGWVPLPLHRTWGSSIQAPVYRIGGRVDGEWLGVISADCEAVDAFSHADGDLLLEFAVKLNVIYEGMFEHGKSVDAAASTP